MDDNNCKKMYPAGPSSPKFYGLPKMHIKDTPFKPPVSIKDSVTYAIANELARCLKPLVRKSIHHFNNTKDFVEHIKNIKLWTGECITSYAAKALFTSVPVGPVIKVIMHTIEQDMELQQRTMMTVHHTIQLLEFCLPCARAQSISQHVDARQLNVPI